jgi:hypothetical protein
MKTSKLFAAIAIAVGCLLFAQRANAQSYIYGSTSISYNASTNQVTGYTTTEIDYAAQDWYQGRVNGSLRDPVNGTVFSSVSATDTDRDGTVSVTTQTTASSGVQYRMIGTHSGRLSIQDYAMGTNYYIDYWAFQPIYNGEDYRYVYMPYFGPGPRRNTNLSSLLLGKTYANFDLDLPPRATATGTQFTPPNVPKQGGQTELQVQISTTRATLEGSQITVEIQVETNPNQVQLEITTFEKTITVGPGQGGQVILAGFPMRTSLNNQASGPVGFRATITAAVGPNGQAIGNGPVPNQNSTITTSVPLTVKP